MKADNIKPIPKYILDRILRRDKVCCLEQNGFVRFYAYLTKNGGELVKVTVAVKNRNKTGIINNAPYTAYTRINAL